MVRVVVVWIFLRMAAMVGAASAAGSTANGVLGPVGLALLVDPIVALVLFIDMTRRGELLFLANLGYSFRGLVVGLVGLCLLLEAALRGALG